MPALLFDLDGTLADTAPDLCAAMNHVLGQYGHAAISIAAMRAMIGGGARVILQRGFNACGVDITPTELDKATELFLTYYDDNIDVHTKLYPHVLSVLEAAQMADIKMAVVTNKREGLSAKLLYRLHIHRYFITLVGGDSLPTRKPDPAPIAEALRRLQVPPQEAVMIGDSEADVEAAKAAGVACVCVSFGYTQTPPAQLGADALIDDFAELIPTLQRLKPTLYSVFDVK